MARVYAGALDLQVEGKCPNPAGRLGDLSDHTDTQCASYNIRMNRTLIIIGIVLIAVGLLWKPLSAMPWFRLPGDFVIARPGFRFYFPLTSMILISAVVSLILWLFRR